MNVLFDEKTIIACSSGGQNNCAISIIRLSGKFQIKQFQIFFSKSLDRIRSNVMYKSQIIEKNHPLDEIMFCFFKAPKSYTGEDLLELYVHGNKLNVKRIIRTFCNNKNVRQAYPGEFTYRALKNKKITITQAEGLDLLLNATSNFMLGQGLDILQGNLHKKFIELHDDFTQLKSTFEIQIDFIEDVGEEEANEQMKKAQMKFEITLLNLFQRTEVDKSSLLFPTIVLLGQTNAGKSTLFNAILGTNRSIVSEIKGTTRDYVSDFVEIFDNQFQIIDTAGFRETNEEIEKEGIRRSKNLNRDAFYRIFVVNPYDTVESELQNLDIGEIDLIVFTHAKDQDFKDYKSKYFKKYENKVLYVDLRSGSIGPDIESGSIGPDIESGSIGPDIESGSIGPRIIYNKTLIKQNIFNNVNMKYLQIVKSDPFLIDRQRESIRNAYNKYLNLKENLYGNHDIAISLSNLSSLENEISKLIGIVSSEDVLENIFNNFCIGK